MALSRSDLMQLLQSLRTADGVETIRMLCERILQELIEAEATEAVGAARGEHSETCTTWRNGHRERLLTTQAGDLDLKIPKVRTGSFFPSLLERRRIDRALFAVVMEAYVHGSRPVRSMTWSKPWAPTAGSPSPRCRGSAANSTPN